ncbi:GNAT family N-acetyltransferase [Streptomyces sp. NPDC001941]|uniref:GNAT family N-acetyltransferase n=1 Tax=Streptomyces sp. NPDC001941 TaxID=3154659 RepID=UPI0033291806
MDLTPVRTLFDRQLRREARADGPGAVVERVGPVVRQTAPASGWNGVLWSGFAPDDDPASVDAVIAEQVAHFGRAGVDFEWKAYGHDAPAFLGDRLTAAGFTAGERETVLVGESTALPAGVPLPPGVTLVPVTDAAGVEQVAEVHHAAFGTDSSRLRAHLLAQLAADSGTVAAVVALADGVPVSSARMEMYRGTDFAGLWGGGTVASWRSRGLYRALVSFRARIAAEHGYRYLQVDAMETSRPILERLGFAALGTTTPYEYASARAERP